MAVLSSPLEVDKDLCAFKDATLVFITKLIFSASKFYLESYVGTVLTILTPTMMNTPLKAFPYFAT
jgi:hypothetical protein